MGEATMVQGGYNLQPGAGDAFWFLGECVTILATSEQTGGAYGLIEDLVAPGGEPPPHSHALEDEAFYILAGALSVSCGDRTFAASVGSFVFLPRGVFHSWRVVGPEPARVLVLFTPGGFEGFFRDGGKPAPSLTPPVLDGPPDMPRVLALAAEYGLSVPPLAPPGPGNDVRYP